jgi:hypothetical protein
MARAEITRVYVARGVQKKGLCNIHTDKEDKTILNSHH